MKVFECFHEISIKLKGVKNTLKARASIDYLQSYSLVTDARDTFRGNLQLTQNQTKSLTIHG
jgi:hypothetical protein